MTQSREVRLKERPVGVPTPDDFEIATVSLPDPGDGEMLIQNLYMSVDPYMRGRMVDRKSYIPPFAIGAPLEGGAIGKVVASNGGRFNVGDHILGMNGWREYYISDGSHLNQVDPSLAPPQAFLGTMGMPGQTAYFGLLDLGAPQPGETVFVSAAAGAVGSTVCQIAKLKGCTVIGSAGSDAKVKWLTDEIGVDAAINYKTAPSLFEAVKEAAPNGIDVYFENVGGEHLEVALAHMNNFGRIPVCGMISQYNDTDPVAGPPNMALIIGKRLKVQGFIVTDYLKRLPEFYGDMSEWAGQGKIKWQETIFDGIDAAPDAFIGLFSGGNLGKMLVKLA